MTQSQMHARLWTWHSSRSGMVSNLWLQVWVGWAQALDAGADWCYGFGRCLPPSSCSLCCRRPGEMLSFI